ncbi:MAG: histone deacetylase [Acidobacteriia bacterium]|jgi:acetoin utilization deacetylase AcuC-like enzyme|nr:histone deacetylase [Terriglobia bacterium]
MRKGKLPFRIVYHEGYDLHLGTHVFPSQKYRLIRETLLSEGLAAPEDFVVPEPASDEDILLVHSQEYVRKLRTGTLSPLEQLRMEIPFSEATRAAFWLAAGGTILAGRLALADGFAANLSGGFHHAFPEHGEGFCMIHDVAVAIRRLQKDGAIRTAMVVDTDVHQGNGTAEIFSGDGDVFTFSIHQANNYPMPKPPSTVDVHLPDRIGDTDYLAILERHLAKALNEFHPDLLFYVGGADPYREDQLGGLSLTLEGLKRRDALVFEYACRRGIPVAITLAGGYARRLEDTVRIHVNTILAAAEVARTRAAVPST